MGDLGLSIDDSLAQRASSSIPVPDPPSLSLSLLYFTRTSLPPYPPASVSSPRKRHTNDRQRQKGGEKKENNNNNLSFFLSFFLCPMYPTDILTYDSLSFHATSHLLSLPPRPIHPILCNTGTMRAPTVLRSG